MDSRVEGDGRVADRVHHFFSFSSRKRECKLSDEGQQEEAKRSKTPEREDV